jgi:diguanylate cyclase (GGDEF)-like protein
MHAKAESSSSPPNPASTIILIADKDGIVNSALEGCTLATGTAPGESLSIEDLWSREVAEQILKSLRRTLRSRKHFSEEIYCRLDDRDSEFLYIAQGPTRVLLVARDLSAQGKALSAVQQLAYSDNLTGLPNREFLFRRLQEITDVQKLKQGRAAVICINIGQFDDSGYALNATQQDQVLQELASRLTRDLRGLNDLQDDNYSRCSIAARTDYRQFSIVLPDIEGGDDAEAVAERIICDLEQVLKVGSRTVNVQVAAGIALFPQDGTSPIPLFDNAAAAMEDARVSSEPRLRFHSGTVRLRSLQRQDLEIEIKTALERQEYTLNFLPILDARTRQPATIEALLRWPDAILGSQPTRKIVRVAERTGQIVEIGAWVFQHACEQLQIWHEGGHDNLRIAVNLSSQELASDKLAPRIARILDESNTDPTDVDIEINEQMLTKEALRGFKTLAALKSLGVRTVVDDFGIGACSLADLSQSPVAAVKIDNTFVAHLGTNERDSAACGAAIAMARELGIDTIAEGVETEEQAQILTQQGCQFLQGFLFGTPRTNAEFLGYLQSLPEEPSAGSTQR